MEPVWNHMLTCDYERTRPCASPLEWDLYTRALRAWPTTLMHVPEPYGRLRRPGIVDINEDDHHQLLATWHAQLRDAAYVNELITRTTGWHRATDYALISVDQALNATDPAAARRHLSTATAAFLDVMSTHIVNWLLPEDDWNHLLTSLFGDAQPAADCLLALMTPATTGHLLASHLEHTPTTSPDPTPPPAADLRRQADTTRQAWEAAAVLVAAGNGDSVTQVRLIAALCTWAATSEESRAILRSRYLAAAHRWAELAGHRGTTLTTRDFHPEGDQ